MRWLILAAVLVSAVNAIIRKTFDTSSNAWLELQGALFGAVFMFAAAYVLQKNGHVRIDALSSHLSKRTRDWIDLFGHVVFLLPFCLLMVWLGIPYFWESLRDGENVEQCRRPGGLAGQIFHPWRLCTSCWRRRFSEIIKRWAVIKGLAP